jgi:hypothetical protein
MESTFIIYALVCPLIEVKYVSQTIDMSNESGARPSPRTRPSAAGRSPSAI